MPFRFSLRSIFLFVTTACVGLALYLYWATWVDSHKQGLALDYQIVDSGRCDVAEYQGGIPLGPFPTQTQRITKLHFNNDLHWHRAEHIAYYNKMPFVSTISFNGDGTLISDRVLGVLETFPRLRTVEIRAAQQGRGDDRHYDGEEYHDSNSLKDRGLIVILK